MRSPEKLPKAAGGVASLKWRWHFGAGLLSSAICASAVFTYLMSRPVIAITVEDTPPLLAQAWCSHITPQMVGLSLTRIDRESLPDESISIGLGAVNLAEDYDLFGSDLPIKLLFPSEGAKDEFAPLCEGNLRFQESAPARWSGEMRCAFADGSVSGEVELTLEPLSFGFTSDKAELSGAFTMVGSIGGAQDAPLVEKVTLLTGAHPLRHVESEAMRGKTNCFGPYDSPPKGYCLGVVANIHDGLDKAFFPLFGEVGELRDE